MIQTRTRTRLLASVTLLVLPSVGCRDGAEANVVPAEPPAIATRQEATMTEPTTIREGEALLRHLGVALSPGQRNEYPGMAAEFWTYMADGTVTISLGRYARAEDARGQAFIIDRALAPGDGGCIAAGLLLVTVAPSDGTPEQRRSVLAKVAPLRPKVVPPPADEPRTLEDAEGWVRARGITLPAGTDDAPPGFPIRARSYVLDGDVRLVIAQLGNEAWQARAQAEMTEGLYKGQGGGALALGPCLLKVLPEYGTMEARTAILVKLRAPATKR